MKSLRDVMVGACLLAGLLFLGCGGEDGKDPASPQQPQSTAPAAPAGVRAEASDGMISVVEHSSPGTVSFRSATP